VTALDVSILKVTATLEFNAVQIPESADALNQIENDVGDPIKILRLVQIESVAASLTPDVSLTRSDPGSSSMPSTTLHSAAP
jgi:hypothetical protein